MTSREIVKAAIHHRNPPRLAVQLDNNVGDMGGLQFKPPASFKPARIGLDEWGCLWKRDDWTCGQVVEHPFKDFHDNKGGNIAGFYRNHFDFLFGNPKVIKKWQL